MKVKKNSLQVAIFLAFVATAGLLNALTITGRDIKNFKMVVNGAGAAGIACVELLKAMGMPSKNAIMCDRKGVISKSRNDLDQWKSAHAVETPHKTLQDALKGADIERKKEEFEKSQELDREKERNVALVQQQRIDISEEALKDKTRIAEERIQTQRDIAAMNNLSRRQ